MLRKAIHKVEQIVDSTKQDLTKKFGRTDPLMIMLYPTYGSDKSLWFKGRMLEDENLSSAPDDGVFTRLRDMVKRYESDEIPNAQITLKLGDQERQVETDDEGYFDLHWQHPPSAALSQPWTEYQATASRAQFAAELEKSDEKDITATGGILVPPKNASFGVISDVDDTIMKTGANNLLRHTRTVLLNNAHSRKPFDGISDFYRALQRGGNEGKKGSPKNPFFYVSSSPWNIHDLMQSFIEMNDLPTGPILLKDFGVDENKLLKSSHSSYKSDRIKSVLDAYPDLPLVLIGDSGQHDAFVYRDIVEEFPDRILAVYIRDLNPGKMSDKLKQAAEEVEKNGVPIRFCADTEIAAEHAREIGLIQ